MRAYYDLHIHSCLSPCASMDMTPNNIIGMATLSELNLIALTDHNATQNCKAVIELGNANGICVVPGMEFSTAEEIHVVCLFPDIENAENFNEFVTAHQNIIKNDEGIYGRQSIMNSQDEETGIIEHLLWVATTISIVNLPKIVEKYSGVCFPAHIDRQSNSVLAVLGEIPVECNFATVEISQKGNIEDFKKQHSILNTMRIVQDTDAHYLENMREKGPYLELDELTPKCLVETLKTKIR